MQALLDMQRVYNSNACETGSKVGPSMAFTIQNRGLKVNAMGGTSRPCVLEGISCERRRRGGRQLHLYKTESAHRGIKRRVRVTKIW